TDSPPGCPTMNGVPASSKAAASTSTVLATPDPPQRPDGARRRRRAGRHSTARTASVRARTGRCHGVMGAEAPGSSRRHCHGRRRGRCLRGKPTGGAMTEALATLTAVELRRRIARKDVSPVELLDACLERIAALNGAVNALAATQFAAARAAARAAEQAVLRG